ncbi:MAG: aminotransferase class I/II-fold pyridoxal phosphate-dependent enzyme [Phycisphaerales bacterium]|nr:aminotransferase class I/II-fold pyridoxal phosphate-dependent enzyme [Planctomycetota bacterium]MCH8509408.1 aminotransferase class I/II-fold pyridoxal phosphate-dependent enzyme [Phycisphaerales bacterium]
MARTDFTPNRFSDLDLICAHAGQGSGDGSPLVTPLVQSTTYCRDGIESTAPHAYSRVSNPTVAALEATLGRLESAPPGVCFGTGLGAETALFLALLRAGDHAVCGRAVYGGTTRLFEKILEPLGVSCTFVDATNPAVVAAAVRPNTRLIFIETPANPTLELTDIRAIARIAKTAGALLAVDNTFLTPVLQQPLELGADITVSSTTKFIEGHSAALGGVIVSRNETVLERVRFIRKCTGGIIAPFNAWLTLQGLKTLPIRLRTQSDNTARIAAWLADRPEVTGVNYPGLESFPQADLAAAQHRGHHGAVLSFDFAAGDRFARAFVTGLTHCRLVEHVGSVETLITHPASMTHADLTPDQRRAVGISDGLVRLSVGLEDFRTIIADFETAFADAAVSCGLGREGAGRCLANA